MTDRPPATRTVWRAVRWPTAALAISLALLVIGLVLDRLPPGRAHEMALVSAGRRSPRCCLCRCSGWLRAWCSTPVGANSADPLG
jgi:hypothetical protein